MVKVKDFKLYSNIVDLKLSFITLGVTVSALNQMLFNNVNIVKCLPVLHRFLVMSLGDMSWLRSSYSLQSHSSYVCITKVSSEPWRGLESKTNNGLC